MKTSLKHTLLLLALSSIPLSSQAGPAAPIIPAGGNNNGSFLDGIHPFLNARLRYEYADIDSMDEATLGSLRTRFGLKTDSFGGFKFLIEGEHTWVLTDTDRYTAFPSFPNNNRAVIADPDNLELNRLQLSYHSDGLATKITVGRQYIKLADERFVGAIGWRQNDETYDAVVVENKSIDNLSIYYAYVDQVNRIFGDNTPARGLDRWEGESHLLHLEYTGIDQHTLRAFAYMLDFDQSAVGRANSSDTYGIELEGDRKLSSGAKLSYLLTAATQSDAGENPARYEENHYRVLLGVDTDSCSFGAGVEVMMGDGSHSFRFPLGTNHKFNGFADAFLVTPANGLVDYYAWVGTEALGFKHKLIAHSFHSEHKSMELGWEVDFVASRQINDHAQLILKAAHLDGKGAQRDVTRASAEVNFAF